MVFLDNQIDFLLKKNSFYYKVYFKFSSYDYNKKIICFFICITSYLFDFIMNLQISY